MPIKKGRTPRRKLPAANSLSPGAHALAALGKECEEVVRKHAIPPGGDSLFSANVDAHIEPIANALRGWENLQNRAQVIEHYLASLQAGRILDGTAVARWIRSHPNEPEAVEDCLNVDPPDEVTIIRVLSRAGSQKLVFLASWNLTQRQVVLKRLAGPPESRAERL
jgi:hypothetical protein